MEDEFMRAFILGNVKTYGKKIDSYEEYVSYMKENVGKKFYAYNHYMRAFKKFEITGAKLNWNWAAFITHWNLAYRKSPYFFFFFLAQKPFLRMDSSMTIIIGLVFNVIQGIFADYFYYKHYKKTLAYAKECFPDDEQQQRAYMANEGGVYSHVPLIAVPLFTAFVVFCVMRNM